MSSPPQYENTDYDSDTETICAPNRGIQEVGSIIRDFAKRNQNRINEIQSKANQKVVCGHTYTLDCKLSHKHAARQSPWTFKSIPVSCSIASLLEHWEYKGKQLHRLMDHFEDRIDYTLNDFADVLRLNKKLLEFACKFVVLYGDEDTEEIRSELKKLVSNMSKIKDAVAELHLLTKDVEDTISDEIQKDMDEVSSSFFKLTRNLPVCKLHLIGKGRIGFDADIAESESEYREPVQSYDEINENDLEVRVSVSPSQSGQDEELLKNIEKKDKRNERVTQKSLAEIDKQLAELEAQHLEVRRRALQNKCSAADLVSEHGDSDIRGKSARIDIEKSHYENTVKLMPQKLKLIQDNIERCSADLVHARQNVILQKEIGGDKVNESQAVVDELERKIMDLKLEYQRHRNAFSNYNKQQQRGLHLPLFSRSSNTAPQGNSNC